MMPDAAETIIIVTNGNKLISYGSEEVKIHTETSDG